MDQAGLWNGDGFPPGPCSLGLPTFRTPYDHSSWAWFPIISPWLWLLTCYLFPWRWTELKALIGFVLKADVQLEPPARPCIVQEAPFLFLSLSPNPACSESLQTKKRPQKSSSTLLGLLQFPSLLLPGTQVPSLALIILPHVGTNLVGGRHTITPYLHSIKLSCAAWGV